jgi:subtilisin-like proprotein convertase family protein
MSAGPPNESGQTLTFAVAGDTNPSLFSAGPAVSANGTLTYTTAANANGAATITLQLKDNGGTANGGQNASATQTFVVTVTPVNDPPTFAVGPNPLVPENSGPQALAAWATGVSAGPPNEAGQAVAFAVVGDTNPALFATPLSVSANGTLTYTPNRNAAGSATVTVRLQDNGGTANGGQNTSASQSFTITVFAVQVTVSPPSLPAGTAGSAYPAVSFTDPGGVGPATYTLSGAMPAGMSFANGVLSGTPLAVGTFGFTVFATDSLGNVGAAGYALVVNPPPPVTLGFGSGTVNAAINNNQRTVGTITVGQSLAIQDVNVTVGISHTSDQDLVLTLVAPDGTQILLANRRGGKGDNYSGTVFDDQAATPIGSGTAPFTGSYRPEWPLSVLNGKDALGTWQLWVDDTKSLHKGTLQNWTLTVTGVPAVGSAEVAAPAAAPAEIPAPRPWHHTPAEHPRPVSTAHAHAAAQLPAPGSRTALVGWVGRPPHAGLQGFDADAPDLRHGVFVG